MTQAVLLMHIKAVERGRSLGAPDKHDQSQRTIGKPVSLLQN